MKNKLMECFQEYSNQVYKEMKDPDIYTVDFIPKPTSGWKNKSNIVNLNHTQKIWFELNKLLNKHLVGRHPERRNKRPHLLHSFNSLEIFHKTKKKEWIKVPPHLHSIIFVHPKIKEKFKELLEVKSQAQVKGLNENSGVNCSTTYTIRPEVFVGEYGTEIKDSNRSLEIRIPYNLEGKVDYSFGLFGNYRPIHPEDVFKDDLEEKQDGMGIFVLPSEHDFKRKRKVYSFGKLEEKIVSLGLGAGIS